jgi:DNA-binding Lrp family transcriptional regulator
MVVACILVCCQAGKFKEVAAELKKMEGVKRAFGVHGRWDAVAEIEVADLKALGETVLKLHGLPGVRATETLISF